MMKANYCSSDLHALLLLLLISLLAAPTNSHSDIRRTTAVSSFYDESPIFECCSFLESSTQLLNCINGSQFSGGDHAAHHQSNHVVKSPKIAFATFYSIEIAEYASRNALINALYVENFAIGSIASSSSSSPTYRLLSEHTGDDFNADDRRWNKIKIIPTALRTWASEFDALVFLDADVALLDRTFHFSNVLRAHPKADIIACEDALDTINTGILVVRNTAAALEIFDIWWNHKGAPNTFCDQHVFNMLYQEVFDKSKIAILPASTFNSRWPALETFDPVDPVLHLMGETTAYRNAVSNYLSTKICQAKISTVSSLASDMSLSGDIEAAVDSVSIPLITRRQLVQIALRTLIEERNRWMLACKALATMEAHYSVAIVEEPFLKLHEATAALCDDSRPSLAIDPNECRGYFEDNLSMIEQAIAAISINNSSNSSSVDAKSMPNEEGIQVMGSVMVDERVLFLMQEAAKTQFKVLYFLPEKGSHRRIAGAACLDRLDRLAELVDPRQPANARYLRHKRGILFASLAVYAQASGDWHQAVEDGKASIDELGTLLSDLDPESDVDFPAYVQEYVNSAKGLCESFRVIGEKELALQWAQIAFHNAQLLATNFAGEERLHQKQLGILAVVVARNAANTGQYTLAWEHVKVAEKIAAKLQKQQVISSTVVASGHYGTTGSSRDRDYAEEIVYALQVLKSSLPLPEEPL